jgi:hypothetical protein
MFAASFDSPGSNCDWHAGSGRAGRRGRTCTSLHSAASLLSSLSESERWLRTRGLAAPCPEWHRHGDARARPNGPLVIAGSVAIETGSGFHLDASELLRFIRVKHCGCRCCEVGSSDSFLTHSLSRPPATKFSHKNEVRCCLLFSIDFPFLVLISHAPRIKRVCRSISPKLFHTL